jgi:hypothetical protein
MSEIIDFPPLEEVLMLGRLSKIFALTSLGLAFAAASTIAQPDQPEGIDQAVNALQRIGSNFFDEGINQFEQEIALLLERQSEPERPLLTFDPSIRLNPDQLEEWERLNSPIEQDSER